jgi:hypothetical protein
MRQFLKRFATGGGLVVAVVIGFAVAVAIGLAVIGLVSMANVSHHSINPPANVQGQP